MSDEDQRICARTGKPHRIQPSASSVGNEAYLDGVVVSLLVDVTCADCFTSGSAKIEVKDINW